MVVGAANALKVYLQRGADASMAGMMYWPLPRDRKDSRHALRLGVALATASVPLLVFAAGAIPALLAMAALAGYLILARR